jgi:hypothetical protein
MTGIRPNPWVRSVVQSSGGMNSFTTAPTWKRVGAILGVIWAFFFLLTIPGWLTLFHYRKWRRGEIPTPNGLIIWGLGFSTFVGIVLLLAISSPH